MVRPLPQVMVGIDDGQVGLWTWNGACHGAEARVGVTRARWPPATLRRRGLAVKARVQGGESEASRV